MKIQDYRHLLDNKEYLEQNILPIYQQEEDKLGFAKMKLLHLFFENGIQHNYDVQYLETLCSLLDQVGTHIFSLSIYQTQLANQEAANRLVHFALPHDLENLSVNLHFYELIFSALETYEVCANITYLQEKVLAEITRKAAHEPQPPKVLRLI